MQRRSCKKAWTHYRRWRPCKLEAALTANANLLLAACGDIGSRISQHLAHVKTLSIWGMRRHPERLLKSIKPLYGDLAKADSLTSEWPNFDVVIATPVPGAIGDRVKRYQTGYLEGAHNLVAKLKQQAHKPFVFWTSSTSVYANLTPKRITENDRAQPTSETGQILLAAEEVIAQSGLPYCIVRPTGIYGPGRLALLRRALQAEPVQNNTAANRIHSEDCAGALAHLACKALAGDALQACYLLTDNEPTPRSQVIRWLRQQMAEKGLALKHESAAQTNSHGHHIANDALLKSGYKLKYPNWQAGYKKLLDSFLETELNDL